MRAISQHFWSVSGIYRRLLLLFATMPNFDNLIVPHILTEKASEQKLMKDFEAAMEFIDNLDLKLILPLITLSVFKNGLYCGYLRDDKDPVVIQSLPVSYCESNYKKDNRYTVHFNLNYFDREYLSMDERLAALDQFPTEIKKYYNDWKSGKIRGVDAEWVLLDTDRAFCFKLMDEMPFFLPIVIDLIELREAKNIELSKDRLELFQLLIHKLPIDKDGSLVFDLPEAKELHQNVLKMLQFNEGIDVLTTFADMEMLNIKETRQVVKDNLLKTERSVFNEAGISQGMFRAEGNLALKYSITTNEALLKMFLPQYSNFFSHAVNLVVTRSAKYYFEVFMPNTTIYNQDDMEAKYLKQAQFGYVKLLPGVIGGMKQSTLLNLIKFENETLKLNEMMEPLQSSHTQSGSDKEPGRPPTPEELKDDETLENEEMGTQEGGDN